MYDSPSLSIGASTNMYDKVIEFVKAAGERLREKAGTLPDIGVAKRFLTEDNLRIDRVFVAAHPSIHAKLLDITRQVLA